MKKTYLPMRKGLTLIEIVIVVALITVITAIYFLVANPAGQLAQTRNNERLLHLQTIMQAVRQNIADQTNEQFSCSSGPIPTSSKKMASGGVSGTYDIGPCLIPVYIFSLPVDPSATSGHYLSNSNYDTGYNIAINSSTGQITLNAPFAEMVNGKSSTISIIR